MHGDRGRLEASALDFFGFPLVFVRGSTKGAGQWRGAVRAFLLRRSPQEKHGHPGESEVQCANCQNTLVPVRDRRLRGWEVEGRECCIRVDSSPLGMVSVLRRMSARSEKTSPNSQHTCWPHRAIGGMGPGGRPPPVYFEGLAASRRPLEFQVLASRQVAFPGRHRPQHST